MQDIFYYRVVVIYNQDELTNKNVQSKLVQSDFYYRVPEWLFCAVGAVLYMYRDVRYITVANSNF